MRKVYWPTQNFVFFSFIMPRSTSTRIKAQPELSTRQQQHRHHGVLQEFAYKTVTPREATSTSEYLYAKSFNLSTCSSLNSEKLVVLKINPDFKQKRKTEIISRHAINKVIRA